MRQTPFVRLHKAGKTFINPAGMAFHALASVDLCVDRGEFVAVVGKSGSGKSTLLNLLTGIDSPTSGEIWVGDTALHTLNQHQLATWRGRSVGIVFQFFQLLPTLTIAENILLAMDFVNVVPAAERELRTRQLLHQVGIADQADKLPATLSGGQQQRAAIARALANDPPLLVADEPTGNLDTYNTTLVLNVLRDLVAAGKTLILVTHDPELAAESGRIITLTNGQIETA